MALNNYKVLGQQSSGTYELLPITNIALTSNIATITTPVNHSIVAGDRFDISATTQSILNVRATAASAPTTTTFTFPRTNTNISSTAQTTAYLYRYSNGLGKTVTNKVKTGGVVTLTTGAAHGFVAGDWVSVWTNDTGIDGDFVIYDVPTTTTFRYMFIGTDISTTSITAGTAAVTVQPAITVYAVPANRSAVCSTLVVANSLTHAAYFTVYIVKSGDSATSPADKTIIANRIAVDAGESYNLTMGYTLATGDKVVVRASHAGMYFNLFGTELS
jgi:hypothetical protein